MKDREEEQGRQLTKAMLLVVTQTLLGDWLERGLKADAEKKARGFGSPQDLGDRGQPCPDCPGNTQG